jgi:hypothetical protein
VPTSDLTVFKILRCHRYFRKQGYYQPMPPPSLSSPPLQSKQCVFYVHCWYLEVAQSVAESATRQIHPTTPRLAHADGPQRAKARIPTATGDNDAPIKSAIPFLFRHRTRSQERFMDGADPRRPPIQNTSARPLPAATRKDSHGLPFLSQHATDNKSATPLTARM